jgi:hypothetical protein
VVTGSGMATGGGVELVGSRTGSRVVTCNRASEMTNSGRIVNSSRIANSDGIVNSGGMVNSRVVTDDGVTSGRNTNPFKITVNVNSITIPTIYRVIVDIETISTLKR